MTSKHPPGPPMTLGIITSALSAAAVILATVAHAQSTSTQLGCSGQLIEPGVSGIAKDGAIDHWFGEGWSGLWVR